MYNLRALSHRKWSSYRPQCERSASNAVMSLKMQCSCDGLHLFSHTVPSTRSMFSSSHLITGVQPKSVWSNTIFFFFYAAIFTLAVLVQKHWICLSINFWYGMKGGTWICRSLQSRHCFSFTAHFLDHQTPRNYCIPIAMLTARPIRPRLQPLAFIR